MSNQLLMINKNIYICLPPFINTTVIKTENKLIVYNYNSFFFYQIMQPRDSTFINIDSETKSFSFETTNEKTFTKLYKNLLEVFFFSWDSYFFEKIKFKGKGYRIAFKKKKENDDILFWSLTWHYFYISMSISKKTT